MHKFTLGDAQRRALVHDLRRLSGAADYVSDPRRVFLPLPIHSLALRRDNLLVRGERGAGKTALFGFLQSFADDPARLCEVLPDAYLDNVRWVEGFSEKPRHPTVTVIDQFVGQGGELERLRLFWTTHLACTLADALEQGSGLPARVRDLWQEKLHEPAAWVDAARSELGALTAWLDRLDGWLGGQGQTVFVTYDYLDRIGQFSPHARGRAAAALLALWLSLINRYRWLRAKIFLREDLFEASQAAFADANKLRGLSVSLEWSVEDLYRVLVRHLAGLSDGMRDWLTARSRPIPLDGSSLLGWLPPPQLPDEAPTGRPSQHTLIAHLAGERIASGGSKGYTYRWIPNRLRDGHGRIVPRSLLSLIQQAAEWADSHGPKATYDHLLADGEVIEALAGASRSRVQELQEEHPIIARMNALRGECLMLGRAEVARRLGGYAVESDGYGRDGEAVTGELLRLGVLKERPDDRIDVPDIYRYHWNIRRRGPT